MSDFREHLKKCLKDPEFAKELEQTKANMERPLRECPFCGNFFDTYDSGYKVHAVDFDGLLCDVAWPEIGQAHDDVIAYFINLQACGNKLILNTCREGKMLEAAKLWCAKRGLIFDAYNENLPERIKQYGGDCRKISADYYYDDKNVFMEGINGQTGNT